MESKKTAARCRRKIQPKPIHNAKSESTKGGGGSREADVPFFPIYPKCRKKNAKAGGCRGSETNESEPGGLCSPGCCLSRAGRQGAVRRSCPFRRATRRQESWGALTGRRYVSTHAHTNVALPPESIRCYESLCRCQALMMTVTPCNADVHKKLGRMCARWGGDGQGVIDELLVGCIGCRVDGRIRQRGEIRGRC